MPAIIKPAWVAVTDIVPLRHRILREGLPPITAHFKGDDDLHTHHAGLFLTDPDNAIENKLVCCASFMLAPLESVPAWQLRGMATEPAVQGRGLGTQLLQWVEGELEQRPEYAYVGMMWCNARESALGFYEKNGWRRVSDMFVIATAGPHYKMTKDL